MATGSILYGESMRGRRLDGLGRSVFRGRVCASPSLAFVFFTKEGRGLWHEFQGAMTAVEICASTIRDVAVAMEAGADRVELCSVWSVGGITPMWSWWRRLRRWACRCMR